MDAKTQAKELVKKYSKLVNGFVGSSMLTNTEYPETILQNAKKASFIVVDEIIEVLRYFNEENAYRDNMKRSYWREVKKEIDKL